MSERVYRTCRGIFGPIIGWLWSLDVEGLDHVPPDGPVLLAANHASFMDGVFLLAATPRPIRFLGKVEAFRFAFNRWVLNAFDVIPVRRGQHDISALEHAREALEAGSLVGIFPEGTRTSDGALQPGHTGLARLAYATGATIVPAGLPTTFGLMPRGRVIPKLGKGVVRFGEGIRVERDEGKAEDPETCRELTERVMRAIAGLVGG